MDLVDVRTRAQQETFAAGNLDAVDIYMTEDIVSHTTPPGMPGGRDGVKAVIGWIHSGLDDVHYEIEDGFSSRDRVVLRTSFGGAHARPWMGHETTGRSFVCEQIHIYRMVEGQIAEHWACRDDVSMMRQLGLIDEPAVAGA